MTVEAGTFLTYKLNQTLETFPGIPGAFEGGNETAYFSNDIGYYVKRQAYANGTPAAEMSLKSYTYGARPAGPSVVDLLLFVAVPIALAGVVAFVIWRRRKRRKHGVPSPDRPSPPREGDSGAR